MKARPLKLQPDGRTMKPCEPREATHLRMEKPGPLPNILIPVITKGTRAGTPCWSWNGDTEKPTIKPSLLQDTYEGDKEIRCHSWINDGKVQFLNDCTHELAGQTLPLLDL